MRTPSTLALSALLLVAGAGCADNRMSLEAYGICSMPDTCTFSSSCDAYAIGPFTYLSAGGTEWFEAAVELRNQLPNNADRSVGRVNSNDAHVTGFRLEIDGPVSGNLTRDVGHQTVPANGTAVIIVPMFPPSSVVALPTGTYSVGVVFIGYYDNGREFESPPFPVAIDVSTTGTLYSCVDPTKVITCGSPQQSLSVCGTP